MLFLLSLTLPVVQRTCVPDSSLSSVPLAEVRADRRLAELHSFIFLAWIRYPVNADFRHPQLYGYARACCSGAAPQPAVSGVS